MGEAGLKVRGRSIRKENVAQIRIPGRQVRESSEEPASPEARLRRPKKELKARLSTGGATAC